MPIQLTNAANEWAAPACPSCGTTSPANLGRLPAADQFAGVRLDKPMPDSCLFECPACHLQFRYPVLDADEMDHLYDKAARGIWRYSFDRRSDWRLAAEVIERRGRRRARMLDVGCWDGEFLMPFRTAHETYGVEINAEAAARAQGRGVSVVGRRFTDLQGHEARYDVITAFDVIEHVRDPLAFLRLLAAHLTEDGCIIVSSGDASSTVWKWLGPRYWYCALAEHVSFVSVDWVHVAARDMGLVAADTFRFSHRTRSLLRAPLEAVAVLTHAVSGDLYHGIKRLAFRGDAIRTVPRFSIARDHFLAVLTRPSKRVSG